MDDDTWTTGSRTSASWNGTVPPQPPPPTGAAGGADAGFGPGAFGPDPFSGDTDPGRGGPSGPRRAALRRSRGDRKVAGVAGGLGRALGIDPVILRVTFVVLTVFGGFGLLLYVLGWLLIPDDSDQVSAVEALLGRGRSSVPPALTLGLALVAVISLFSMFSWGLPFLPLAVIAAVAAWALSRRSRGRRGSAGFGGSGRRPSLGADRWPGRAEYWQGRADRWARQVDRRMQWMSDRGGHWERHAERWAQQISRQAERWSLQAERFGRRAEHWGDRRTGSGETLAPSPFDRPPFWQSPEPVRLTKDQPGATTRPVPTGAAGDGVPGVVGGRPVSADPALPAGTHPPHRTTSAAADAVTAGDIDPADPLARRTPPAWDPLGAAPFAWDLPEPAPLSTAVAIRPHGLGAVGRITLALTLLSGTLVATGILAGWWAAPWALVTGVALAVLAVGLLLTALNGRGRALIGPGVFLALVTLALGVTGISGTDGYGRTVWHPTGPAAVESSYVMNAGYGTLDLSGVTVPAGQHLSVVLQVRAGRGEVVLPAHTAATVECHTDAGAADCLHTRIDGAFQDVTTSLPGDKTHGSIDLTVKVRAGYAEVVTR